MSDIPSVNNVWHLAKTAPVRHGRRPGLSLRAFGALIAGARMSPVTSEPAMNSEELSLLLNQATLALNPAVRTAKYSHDRLVVKNEAAGRTIVVTPAQWELLQQFQPPRTAAATLIALVSVQRCPVLSQFYELVVQAAQAGILLSDRQPPPPDVAASRWPLKFPGMLARGLTVVSLGFAVAMLAWQRLELPTEPKWLAVGWLEVCAATSLGWMLAASVVRSAGGSVYRAGFQWKTLIPSWQADLSDAALGGRGARVNVALARLLPLLAATGVAVWKFPPLVLPLVLGLALELAPFRTSPLAELLAAWFRDPLTSIHFNYGVARSRLFTLLLHARQQVSAPRFLFVSALATLGWLLLVLVVGAALLNANALELIRRFNEAGGWHYTAFAGLGLIGLVTLAAFLTLVAAGVNHVRTWWHERAERKARPEAVLVSAQTIAAWLSRTLLFQHLPAADLELLAGAMKPEEHKRGNFVVREGEPGDCLYVILSGRLEVRRDYAPGRSEPVAELGEGEIFGEIALLQGGLRTRSIRARERSVLLALGKADFERLVLTRMSRDAVLDEVQKMGFLQHTELARNWRPSALAAFARRSQFREMPQGTVVMREGEANNWFYLVHRGELSVHLDGRELRSLKIGDTFGELSLLGDGLATSTVTVKSKVASCLAISGRDFVEFVAHDFAIGMRWEKLRLRPVERRGSRPQRDLKG